LGACRHKCDTVRAQRIFDRAISLNIWNDGHKASAYVILANTYAAAGNYEKSDEIRREMKLKKIEENSRDVLLRV